jgi:hypothetical protein
MYQIVVANLMYSAVNKMLSEFECLVQPNRWRTCKPFEGVPKDLDAHKYEAIISAAARGFEYLFRSQTGSSGVLLNLPKTVSIETARHGRAWGPLQ